MSAIPWSSGRGAGEARGVPPRGGSGAAASPFVAPVPGRAPGGVGAWGVSALLLAGVLFGFVGGYFGFEIQALLALLVVVLFAVSHSHRLAIGLLTCMLFLNGTTLPFIPRLLQNLVILGLPMLFIARIALRAVLGRDTNVALPKELLGYVAVMAVGTLIGYIHLDEINPLVVAATSTGAYGFKEYVIGLVLKQMALVALAVIIASVVLDLRRGEWVIAVVALSAVLFVGAMFALFVAGGYGVGALGTHRALFIKLGRHNNEVGWMLTVAIAMTLFAREGMKGAGRRLLMLALVAVMLAGVVMTASRGAVVGLFFVFAAYAVMYRRLGSVLTALLVLVLAFAAAPQPVQDRFMLGLDSRYGVQVSAGPGDELTSGRLSIWRQLAPEVLEHPVLGNGVRSTLWSRYNRYGGGFKVAHPHNMYLASLLDHGVLGTLLIALFYAYVWRQSRRLSRDPRVGATMQHFFRGGVAVIGATLVMGLFNGVAYPAPEQLYFWIFAGVTIGYAYLYRTPPPVPVQARPYRPWQAPRPARAGWSAARAPAARGWR